MQKQTLKLGEILIRQGEYPEYFYVIASGKCDIVMITEIDRAANFDINSINFKQPQQRLDFSNKNVNFRVKNSEKITEDHIYKSYSKRAFKYDPVCNSENKSSSNQYYDHFYISTLGEGDCLCARSILSKDISMNGTTITEGEPRIKKAHFTVLASTAKTEVYEFHKNMIVFLPQPLKGIFMDGAKKFSDHDLGDSEHMKTDFIKWDEFKEKCMLKELERKAELEQINNFKRF